MKWILLLAFALTGCATLPQGGSAAPEGNPPVIETQPEGNPPVTLPTPSVKIPANCEAILAAGRKQPACPQDKHPYKVWDMAARLDRPLAEFMACSGFTGMIRYLDWEDAPTIATKIPNAAELAIAKEFGFEIALVFQHNNRPIANFESASKRKRDLAEILKLAAKFQIPKGAAIYLGVDHDHWTAAELKIVRGYFEAIAPSLRAAGYRVGMYGSGANCISLSGAKLIDNAQGGKPLCWLAGATGWSRTGEVKKAGNFVLLQKVNQQCFGRNLDYNIQNSADYGQWRLQ